jgi:hypothetical protein
MSVLLHVLLHTNLHGDTEEAMGNIGRLIPTNLAKYPGIIHRLLLDPLNPEP